VVAYIKKYKLKPMYFTYSKPSSGSLIVIEKIVCFTYAMQ